MSTVELTIKTDYLPNWGVREGLRELLQNAKDSEAEFGAPMSVKYDAKRMVAKIENRGAKIPQEALLLGYTSKSGRGDLIGVFGEGLKLGTLALVRSGCSVRIRSGGEVWTPEIRRSAKFDAEVLAFDIRGGNKDLDRVCVEVEGIDPRLWADTTSRILWMSKNPGETIESMYGTVLLDPRFRGRVFVKGMQVTMDEGLQYGYDMKELETDRDRKLVDPWALKYSMMKIWMDASNREPDLASKVAELIEVPEAADLSHFDGGYVGHSVNSYVMDAVADRFEESWGEDAVPVKTVQESREAEHYGKKGVVVSSRQRGFLSCKYGEDPLSSLRRGASRTWGWHELEEGEKRSLEWAMRLSGTEGDPMEVVDFFSASMLGLYDGGKILLARKTLADRTEALKVLVHEKAHEGGGDGEKGHVDRMQDIWAGIVRKLAPPEDRA